jgi:hypothetical protein
MHASVRGLIIGFGSTKGGLISKMVGHQECHRITSIDRVFSGVETKVVDIDSGELLLTNNE